ncbi:uncharacterized protein [Henckelia pumila]|uniref:uncharacterized protein n=1 Tax=Henckelia pumila TaxID=405737 RepID=UPI003C6E603A
MVHRLNILAGARPIKQKKRHFGPEKDKVIKKEVEELLRAGHIREVQFPSWLSNVVLVPKSSGKWRMCVDFRDLNKACPKDCYPLPRIDKLVDSTAGEDPHKHLMEFHVVCSSMKPHGITEEQIQLRAFPFSLKSSAKDWLYYLPSGSITTWTEMKRIFLEKYFPASRASNIRKEIYGCKQQMGESLHEYWERFKKLCASCPQHQISENLLIQYCYEGLLSHDRNMLDAASGGVFVDKTPVQARNLIENMAANSQQFGTNRSDPAPRKSNEGMDTLLRYVESALKWDMQLTCVPLFKRDIRNKSMQQEDFQGHLSRSMILTLTHLIQVGGIIQTSDMAIHKRISLDLKHHSTINLIGNRTLHHITLRFLRQDTRASIQNLNTQMGKLAAAINKLEAQNFSRLPSQTVVNPRENVSAITLRSGKELQIQNGLVKELVETEGDEESKVEESDPTPNEAPRALKDSRKNEGIKELYETFRRCGVNIPLLDAIKQLDIAMLDLGASINVMSYSVYASLNLAPLNETDIVIQMAERSTIFPRGLLEDVLVQIGELVFPADFYILDMKNKELNSPILLGRPFLKTSKSVIDVDNGTLTMEFDGKIAKFNIFDALKNPVCESVVHILATPAEISTAENFISDMQAPKIVTKHPPDRAKRIAKKSKQKNMEH